jgi:hypothetical protein
MGLKWSAIPESTQQKLEKAILQKSATELMKIDLSFFLKACKELEYSWWATNEMKKSIHEIIVRYVIQKDMKKEKNPKVPINFLILVNKFERKKKPTKNVSEEVTAGSTPPAVDFEQYLEKTIEDCFSLLTGENIVNLVYW